MAEPTLWQSVLSWLRPSDEVRETRQAERIRELSRALARDPQSAATVVSRGEAFLEAGDYAAAANDFRQALALSEAQFKTETWGVVAQAIRDRALHGLKQAQELSSADGVGQKTGKG